MQYLIKDVKQVLAGYILKTPEGRKSLTRLRMTCKTLLYDKNIKKKVRNHHPCGSLAQRKKDFRTMKRIFNESELPAILKDICSQKLVCVRGFFVTYKVQIRYIFKSEMFKYHGVRQAFERKLWKLLCEFTGLKRHRIKVNVYHITPLGQFNSCSSCSLKMTLNI
jgi:hypothetical protein